MYFRLNYKIVNHSLTAELLFYPLLKTSHCSQAATKNMKNNTSETSGKSYNQASIEENE